MRRTATVTATAALLLLGVAPAQAAADRSCAGAFTIFKATLVHDQGAIGVLDGGDVFRLKFRQQVLYNDPSFSIDFTSSSNGEVDSLDDPGGETRLSGSGRYLTVEIQEEDIVGDPVTIALPLPVTITSLSGVVRDADYREPSLACSKDVVL
ncbi:hypothetical protein [Modestobacter sp. URMC 112]